MVEDDMVELRGGSSGILSEEMHAQRVDVIKRERGSLKDKEYVSGSEARWCRSKS